jgi:hypothetical protein
VVYFHFFTGYVFTASPCREKLSTTDATPAHGIFPRAIDNVMDNVGSPTVFLAQNASRPVSSIAKGKLYATVKCTYSEDLPT